MAESTEKLIVTLGLDADQFRKDLDDLKEKTSDFTAPYVRMKCLDMLRGNATTWQIWLKEAHALSEFVLYGLKIPDDATNG